jgi:transposase
MRRYELSDAEWALISDLMPEPHTSADSWAGKTLRGIRSASFPPGSVPNRLSSAWRSFLPRALRSRSSPRVDAEASIKRTYMQGLLHAVSCIGGINKRTIFDTLENRRLLTISTGVSHTPFLIPPLTPRSGCPAL